MYRILLYINLLFVSLTLAQTNYYISDTDGNDANNGKSPASAWKTLQKLNNSWGLINPGDSILLKRGDTFAPPTISTVGVVHIPVGKSGNSSAYIVMGAYGNPSLARPVISNKQVSAYSVAVRLQSQSYFIYQDIHFIGELSLRASDSDMGLHHVKFLRLKISEGRMGFYNPYAPANTPEPNIAKPLNNIEIGYCEFENTIGEDCINMGSANGNIWIHHNTFHKISEEAIDIGGGDNNIVEYNFISGTTVQGIKLHSQFMEQRYTIVRGNVIQGAGSYAFAYENVTDGQIYNNTFYGNPNAMFLGWLHANAPLVNEFAGNVFSNNIIIGTVITGMPKNVNYTYRNGTTENLQVGEMWENNSFYNNTYYTFNNSPIHRFIYYTGSIAYNASVLPYGRYETQADYAQTDARIYPSEIASKWLTKANVHNDRFANPEMINLSYTSAFVYGNLRLRDGSSSLGTGIPVAGFEYDLDGNSINTAMNLDPGAYQKSSLGADVTMPQLISAAAGSESSLMLSFSENLGISASQASNYTITGGISVLSAQRQADNSKVLLTTSAFIPNSSYTVSVSGVSDNSGNSINPSANTASFTYSVVLDTDPPEIQSSVYINSQSVRIVFTEVLEETSAENTLNYSVSGGVSVSSAVLSNDNEVTIGTSVHSPGTSYTVTVAGVKDLAGNAISANNTSVYSVPAEPSQSGTFVNLTTNGNFESGSKSGWYESNALGGAVYTFSVSSSSPVSGSYSGVINISQAGTSDSRPMIYVALTEPVVSGSSYTFKFKTKVLSGNPKIQYYAAGTSSKLFNNNLSGTQDWVIEIPSATNTLQHVYLYFDGTATGSVAIDDIQFGLKAAPQAQLTGAKVILEGAWNNTIHNSGIAVPLTQPYNSAPHNYGGIEAVASVPADVLDWILLELRTGTAPDTKAAEAAAFVKKDGSIVSASGNASVVFNVSEGNYYVVIHHRNHLSIMSNSAVSLSSGAASYNFSDSAVKSYGDDAVKDLGGGYFGMYAGDADNNGIINTFDYKAVNDNLNKTGYEKADTDFSGIVTESDFQKPETNLFKTSKVPR